MIYRFKFREDIYYLKINNFSIRLKLFNELIQVSSNLYQNINQVFKKCSFTSILNLANNYITFLKSK